MTDEAIKGLRAMAHPVRLRMLSLLTGSAMSAAEVARELDLTHANASYHLRILLASGEIVEAGEERIRGGVAKRYRYPHEQRGQHSKVRSSAVDEVAYARTLGRELERRARDKKPRGKGVSSDLEGWVTPEVFQQAVDLLAQASFLLHDHNQPPRTPGTVHFSETSWAFQMTTEKNSGKDAS